jgi:hypothetical protein
MEKEEHMNRFGIKLIACLFVLSLAACGNDSRAYAPIIVPDSYAPVIDPGNFTIVVNNPYFPLSRGTIQIYEGKTDEGLESVTDQVTIDTKVVMGVECIVVHNWVELDGALIEETWDWYAQDKEGNVWYFGEDTKEYENGVVTTTAGSWEAGVDGALPGIIMPANPQVGDAYRQEYFKGEAEDMAEIMSLDESVTVTYGSFSDALKIKEWTPLSPDVVEFKYYAPGVGLILEEIVKGGEGRIELIMTGLLN